jgi:hypothetical protein
MRPYEGYQWGFLDVKEQGTEKRESREQDQGSENTDQRTEDGTREPWMGEIVVLCRAGWGDARMILAPVGMVGREGLRAK